VAFSISSILRELTFILKLESSQLMAEQRASSAQNRVSSDEDIILLILMIFCFSLCFCRSDQVRSGQLK
jgi:hypothetical protein